MAAQRDNIDPAVKALIEKAANRAATMAVRQTLLAIGIDVSTPQAALEHQADARFTRRMRQATETRAAKIWLAGLSALFALLVGIGTMFIQRLIGKD